MINKKFLIDSAVLGVVAAAIIVIDRVVKSWIMQNCTTGEVFGKFPFVADYIYVKNTGAAFSMLSGNVGILSIVSIVFCVAAVIFWIIKKPHEPLMKISIALLFSGALGNAIDRISYGFVVDFISLKWFNFPVFNIADIAIVLGAVFLIIFVLFFDKSEDKRKTDGGEK